MFKVYALYHEAFGGSTQNPVAIFGSELADESEVLEIIFNLTQNLDYPWFGDKRPTHPEVRLMAKMSGAHRSTSVDDRIVVNTGEDGAVTTIYRVAGAGFTKIGESK